MEWENKFFLTDEEIKILAIFLAYGVGIGVFIGMFLNNIILYFSLGGVLSILCGIIKISLTKKVKK